MRLQPSFNRNSVRCAAGIAMAVVAAILGPAWRCQAASTLTTLHSFCALDNCPDGQEPAAGLIMDSSGRLYGTTQNGGKQQYGGGVVFRLDPEGSKYREHILHSFNQDYPSSDLIMDTAGNLYGTTQQGGQHGDGFIFRLSPKSGGWSEANLHSFDGSTQYAYPSGLSYVGQASGALWDGMSPLYGTAPGGKYYNGVAYQLTHSGHTWTYHVIHDFQSSSDPNELLVASSGNLYGTTSQGGAYGGGLLFKLENGTWKETVFHQFCAKANCADGKAPFGRLINDGAGNLFGSTGFGGSGSQCPDSQGCGVVFEHVGGGGYTVIYDFCKAANCPDGQNPNAPIMDGAGHLFGTTVSGGDYGRGTIFELMKVSGNWSESILHAFGQSEGIEPNGSLVMNPAGDLFGTTFNGGKYYLLGGTVFRLTR